MGSSDRSRKALIVLDLDAVEDLVEVLLAREHVDELAEVLLEDRLFLLLRALGGALFLLFRIGLLRAGHSLDVAVEVLLAALGLLFLQRAPVLEVVETAEALRRLRKIAVLLLADPDALAR